MNILSITTQKPHSTGSGTYMTELIRAYDAMGHNQSVVFGVTKDDDYNFPDSVNSYPVYYSSEDLTFPVLGMSDVMPYQSTLYKDLNKEMISQLERAFMKVIGKAIEDNKPDIIICHHLFLLTSMVVKNFPDFMVVGICHGSDLRQNIQCENIAYEVKDNIASLHHIFALHDKQKDTIAELFNISKDKISVVGSGYNSSLFNTRGRKARRLEDPVRIIYAGKMSSSKGVPELISSVTELLNSERISRSVPQIKLALAGGCNEEGVQNMLKNLPHGITWLGQISQAELANQFRASDIFILPSYFEGLGLVVIEAVACGAIAICTDIPGIKEWICKNAPEADVRYIPMPELKSVDMPTDKARIKFKNDISKELSNAINFVVENSDKSVLNDADLSSISWDGVAKKIIENCC